MKSNGILRKVNGITLIALVITIVVLLILAGISINAVLGNNGLITKARETRLEQAHAQVRDALALWYGDYQIEVLTAKENGATEVAKLASLQVAVAGDTSSFLAYLISNNIANSNGTINVTNLLGSSLNYGNGTGTADVYKVIENSGTYELNYYDEEGNTTLLDTYGGTTTGSNPAPDEIERVEPENIDDWEYRIEEDGTATLTMYKGNKTEVVFPNYIEGIPVKTIGTNGKRDSNLEGGDETIFYSIWSPTICAEVSFDGGYVTIDINQNTITKITMSEGIEKIEDYAFYYSTALEKVLLPTTITSIGAYAFDECTNLERVAYKGTETQWNTITIGSNNTDLTGATIGYEYSAIQGNIEVIEPDNIDDWEYTIEDDGSITLTMYKGDDTELVIPNYINGTPVKKIGINAKYSDEYDNFPSLWSSDICEEIEGIGTYGTGTAKINQTSITKIIVTEGIEAISTKAFQYSSALQDVILPTTITSIGAYAFDECTNLTTVYYRGTESQWRVDVEESSEINENIVYNYTGE